MRGTGLAAVAIALAWVSAASSSSSPPKPHLRVLDRAPLVIRGTRFHAREHVRVTVTTAGSSTRTIRAGRGGSFTARFDGVSVDRCGDLSVSAAGARGDRASLKVLQPEDCAPGLGP